ncbi:Hypothetical predicted protein [Olea europaea subsp. europaea]|uniref:COP9 signalosome complex subunit 2 n=1 Tax=Olea europaea subsp. europaea TaxID=158383 RepID=A0A8S0SKU0_OLEEU|nr:Hypothetical predicted protein [Olea europaea subsp. europaea]
MASDADMEDYGFEYSDEEPEEEDVVIENQYYNSKGLVETDPEAALEGFAKVVRMEPDKAECFADSFLYEIVETVNFVTIYRRS